VLFQWKVKSALRGRGWPKRRQIGASHYEQYGVNYRVLEHAGPITERDVPHADAVIATFWTTAHWAAELPWEKGGKLYLVQHDEGSLHAANPEAEATYALGLRHVYVSSWIADRIATRHPTAVGEVIPNAVEVERFDSGVRRAPGRAVGMMWSPSWIKGSDVALEAVRQARRRVPGLEVIGFGATAPTKDVADVFDRFELTPDGRVMAEMYGTSRAWLFSSRFEGFGLPILEAMAARTPVIGTRTGAAPDLIGPENGRLIDVDAVDAMADAIVQTVKLDDASWLAMSDAAHRTAISYTWDDATDRFEAILKSICEGSKSSQPVGADEKAAAR
jgi:glycosyltransferase involved in cell wall biosynthesis